MSRSKLSLKNVTLALAAAALTVMTTGCGMTSAGVGDLPANLHVSGTVMGGRQPIVGSALTLYATGNTGYGSTATSLGTATTSASGTFTITRNANTCSDPQQVYLVASGGDAGSGANSAAVLVAALGTCSSVTTSTTGLVINEVTTVAAAYALQGFADTGVNIGTSSTNAQGLTHAFANALNIVATNGTVNSTTVGGNGTVPTAVINTIGNVLASCVNSTGPSSSGCTAVLLGAPSVVGAPAPTNVWQEALNMARYPANQTAALYATVTTTGPFQTALAAQPNDFSIGIPYSAGLETDGATAATFPWDIKADANDNIWVTGMTKAPLVELSNTGTLLSPSSGGWGGATFGAVTSSFTHGIAFDQTGSSNVWIADNVGIIWKYTPAGTATAPTAGTLVNIPAASPKGPIGIGVDSNNNVWFGTEGTAATTQGIGEVAVGTTTATYPTNSAYNSGTATAGTFTLFVDAANGNHIYAGTQTSTSPNGGVFYEYLSTAAPLETTPIAANPTNGVAIDKNGTLWGVYTGSGVNGGQLAKFTPGTATATSLCKVVVNGGGGLYNPRGIVIDGNNRIFITSYTNVSSQTYGPGIVMFDPALGTGCNTNNDAGTFFLTPNGSAVDPSTSSGGLAIAPSAARNETIDSSGALWTMNGASTAGYQPVVQVLGMAAPVNPVLAAGKYGARP